MRVALDKDRMCNQLFKLANENRPAEDDAKNFSRCYSEHEIQIYMTAYYDGVKEALRHVKRLLNGKVTE